METPVIDSPTPAALRTVTGCRVVVGGKFIAQTS